MSDKKYWFISYTRTRWNEDASFWNTVSEEHPFIWEENMRSDDGPSYTILSFHLLTPEDYEVYKKLYE